MNKTKFKPDSDKSEGFKKFIGNKKEGQGFADKRKKKAAYEYLKLLKKEKTRDIKTGKEPAKHNVLAFKNPSQQGTKDKSKKASAFTVAERIARKNQDEQSKKIKEIQKSQQDKEEALKSYKQRKKDQHLKLCKRTSKGQPVMRHQMEVLLDKIKKQKDGGGGGDGLGRAWQ